MSVGMSVCLSALISQTSHVQTSRNFLCILTVDVAHFSSNNNALLWIPSGFTQNALGDLCPWCCHLANSTKHNRPAWFLPIGTIMWKQCHRQNRT